MPKQTRTTKKVKTPGFWLGKAALFLFSAVLGVFCIVGWLESDANDANRYVMSALAGASALVIPFTIGALGRSAASFALLLPNALALLMSAYSTHNAVEVLVEHPRYEAHVASLEVLTSDLASAKAARAALQAPLYVAPACQSFCTNPIKAAQATWQAQRDAYNADVKTADAAVAAVQARYDTAMASYAPLISGTLVAIIGGLLDLGVAVGIWALEATSRRIERANRADAEQRQAERQREKAKRQKQLAKKPRATTPSSVLTAAEIAAFNHSGGLRVVRSN